MSNILILHDFRGFVTGSLVAKSGKKIDISQLKTNLQKQGHNVDVKSLHDLKFPSVYNGWFVIYPSSEDAGLFYKEFIEDIILRLRLDGAILLPGFEYFRAHHNKVFMELYRTHLKDTSLHSLKSYMVYSMSDLKGFLNDVPEKISYPVVIKTASGAGSSGVALAHNERELRKKIKYMGKAVLINYNFSIKQKTRSLGGKFLRKLFDKEHIQQIAAREKMIIQPFIPNLKFDYKVLIYGDKYYILKRDVREKDFRASGSGKLLFPQPFTHIEEQVLDMAECVFKELNVPFLSVDIAHDGKKCHMIEFQCLTFGPYTLEYSPCYYHKILGTWDEVKGKSVLEVEIANAVEWFIKKDFGD